MGRYGAGTVAATGTNTADRGYFQVRGATGQRLKVVKLFIGIITAPTTAPAWYLARTTAIGATPVGSLTGQKFDGADVAAAGSVDWGTYGTNPTFTAANKIDGGMVPLAVGNGWLWTFYDSPLVVAASAAESIVIANANASGATTGVYQASAVWDE